MDKIEEYVRKSSLLFTDTIDKEEFWDDSLVLDYFDVNMQDSISLYNLTSEYNKLYLLFRKEYDELEKLNLGKKVYFNDFGEFESDGDKYRVLTLFIDQPTVIDKPYTLLYLREINGKIKPFATDVHHRYREPVELDQELVKKYLALFEKYQILLNAYSALRNSQPYGDGINCMFIATDSDNNDLINGLDHITVSFGCTSAKMQYYINLIIKLGEAFGVDYENSTVRLNGEDCDIDNDKYDTIFNNTCINKRYLKEKKNN